ncbi:MAG: LPXTG cell wall anchor domain-containing protein [Anaeroplasmataceae bacterium]|nr:LPXTG cell wall anchor domain-containing protein [Anaeroplasmataceae bacterium]
MTIYDISSYAIDNATSPIYILAVLGIFLLGGGIGIFIYFKKKRNCNTNENKL